MYYMRDGEDEIVETDNVIERGEWFENAERHVWITSMHWWDQACVKVSTVFLWLDHSFGEWPPLLFETMVFGDPEYDGDMRRYATAQEARIWHTQACRFYEEKVNLRLWHVEAFTSTDETWHDS